MRMRVCLAQNISISDHLALSTYLRNISECLGREEGIELHLIVLKGLMVPEGISKNVNVHEISGRLYSIKGNLGYIRGLYRELKRISEEGDIDVVHCIYPLSSVVGAILFKMKSPKTKIVYDIRSPWIDMSIQRGFVSRYTAMIYRNTAYFIERFVSNYVDGFIFITEGLRQFYKDKINLDAKPVEIIPSGIDLKLFSRRDPGVIRGRYGVTDDEILLGYSGGIAKIRELDVILESFREICRERGEYKLMFVGDGDDRERLETLSRKLNLQKKVIFTGRVSYDQIPYYISAFNFGLCHLPDVPVYRHSFPLKILEYLACGVPVLASNIEAHREIAKELDGITIYDDAEGFSEKIMDYDKRKINVPDTYEWKFITFRIIKFFGFVDTERQKHT